MLMLLYPIIEGMNDNIEQRLNLYLEFNKYVRYVVLIYLLDDISIIYFVPTVLNLCK